jgi:hypothetical protein
VTKSVERQAVANEALPDLARIDDDTLRELHSFDDAMQLATELHGSVEDIADEIGNGFVVLKDKSKLIGQKCLFIEWRFLDGDYGDDGFVAVTVMTARNEKFILTDGSTGIRDQLRDLTARTGRYGGYLVNSGLRVSQYDTCDECGKPRTRNELTCSRCDDVSDKRSKGETFYIDQALSN